jgi:type I restriction enzyme M protein
MVQKNLDKTLDINTLETWLWEAACKIRGEVDAPKYKDYILPIIFLKRLSDVFEDELEMLTARFGNRDKVEELVYDDHELVRFYLPKETRWDAISSETTNVGQSLTDATRLIARENPSLEGVVDNVDFNATTSGQRIISDDNILALIDILGRYRLGLKDVEPDILGRAYEYLLRKFAEGSGSSAGEFYTPKEVAITMAKILSPRAGESIYDPCCGSGGLLIKCALEYIETHEDKTAAPLQFYGQEILAPTYSMAKMNMFIHDMDAKIALGDTMRNPKFTNSDSSLMQFDIVTANPMWNQKFDQSTYEHDTYGRFVYGYPPNNSADWGWIQHMCASLSDTGRMAIVLDTGAVSRGSGNTGKNKERDIRREVVERDLVEAVVLLPDNLFYNTSAPGIVIVINKAKRHPGEIMLINATSLVKKGRPKNYIPDEFIEQIAGYYRSWSAEEGIAAVITTEDAAKNDYNLSPSRYVAQNGGDDVLSLEDAVVLLREAEEERQKADDKLAEILRELGL